MKNLSLLLALLVTTSYVFAQIEDAKEISIQMSEGVQQGWKILIPEANSKDALKGWEKLMKAYDSKTSKVKKHDEYKSADAYIPSLSERIVVVYSQFNETPEGVYLTVFFDLGGAYLNSHMHEDKVKAVQKLLTTFAKEIALEAIEDKVKEEEKALKKLENEKNSLQNDKENYEKEIQECEAKIAQRKSDLNNNQQEQVKKEKEIKEQQERVEEIKKKKKKF